MTLLRKAEQAAIMIAMAAIYVLATDAPWWLFALLFFAPDLSFAAYLAGPAIGAIAYNAVHSYALPSLLALLWLAGGPVWLAWVGLIVAAHIGFDRMLGYGLKRASGFRDTHLGRIGRD